MDKASFFGRTNLERHDLQTRAFADDQQLSEDGSSLTAVAAKILNAASRMDDPVKYVTVKINNCAIKKSCSLAQAIFDGALKRNIAPNLITYNTLIKAYVYAGRLPKALEIFNSLDGKQSEIKPDLATYNTLIHGCAIGKNAGGAFYLISRMKQSGIEPDVWTFTSLLQACLKSDRIGEAQQMMKQSGVYPNVVTFNTMINNLIENGNLPDALDLLDTMSKCEIVPDDYTFTILSKGYKATPELKQILGLLDKLETMGFVPGQVVVGLLIESCLKFEIPKTAMAIFNAYSKDDDVPTDSIYVNVMKIFVTLEMPEKAQAFHATAMAKGVQLKRESYFKVLMSCHEGRDADLAFDLYTEMKKAGIPLDKASLTRILTLCDKANQGLRKIAIRSHYNSLSSICQNEDIGDKISGKVAITGRFTNSTI